MKLIYKLKVTRRNTALNQSSPIPEPQPLEDSQKETHRTHKQRQTEDYSDRHV